ncbi:MAG: hypothetical protein IPL26_25140 [Leptospiraceae bacterium]|nr:hypothetical protein [Leptospiraceae bacterium]
MVKIILVFSFVIISACLNSEDSKEKSFEERSRLMQVLNTGSGSSGNYYSTDGTYIGDSNSGTINNNEWSLNYIANLSSGDCKALASSDRYYCTTADCKGIVQRDRYYCKTSDCKGVATNDRYYCKSKLCKAWVLRDRYYCDSSDYDCKAIASGDPYYCRSKQCKAIVRRDRYYCN